MYANQPEGILLVDKPQGITSHDVVDRIRRIYQIRKVGHAGTLDPMATGLLIILVGKATKASQYLMSLSKTYEGRMRFGQVTDTQDADGDIVEEHPLPENMSGAKIAEAMTKYRGDQYQTPPMFSAKKIKGVPLYKLARQGRETEREPRFIHVTRFDLIDFERPEATFILQCSKGTYVRTVVHDLGRDLGCGAHLVALRRTLIDRFSVKDSSTLEELAGASTRSRLDRLIPVKEAVPSHAI